MYLHISDQSKIVIKDLNNFYTFNKNEKISIQKKTKFYGEK